MTYPDLCHERTGYNLCDGDMGESGGMTASKKAGRDFNAYKPVDVTDGLTQSVRHHFDATMEMKPDDIAMLKSLLSRLAPHERIANMQDRLNSLKNATPEINLHADAIRSIYAELDTRFDLSAEGLFALDSADQLWRKILVLRHVVPLAKKGEKHGIDQANRRTGKTKLTEQEKGQVRREYKAAVAQYGEIKRLAGKFNVSDDTISRIVNRE